MNGKELKALALEIAATKVEFTDYEIPSDAEVSIEIANGRYNIEVAIVGQLLAPDGKVFEHNSFVKFQMNEEGDEDFTEMGEALRRMPDNAVGQTIVAPIGKGEKSKLRIVGDRANVLAKAASMLQGQYPGWKVDSEGFIEYAYQLTIKA